MDYDKRKQRQLINSLNLYFSNKAFSQAVSHIIHKNATVTVGSCNTATLCVCQPFSKNLYMYR